MKNRMIAVGSLALIVAGCSQTQAPGPIYAEPVFDKFGSPSCRPGDVPVGGSYTADLPVCPLLQTPPEASALDGEDGQMPDTDVEQTETPDEDPSGGQNRSNSQNQTNNQNNNRQGQ